MARPPKMVELYIEPFIDLSMQFVVLVANFLSTHSFLQSFDLGGCAILVSAAYEHHIVAPHSAISGIYVG